MLETAVQKFLGPTLGGWVQNFSRQNLKIGLWSGKVQIKDVELKKDLPKKFNLPLTLNYSKLGNLTMIIPWKSLASSKTELIIEGLEVVVSEIEQSKWDVKNTQIVEERKKQIQNYYEKILNDFASKTIGKVKQELQKTFLGKIVSKVIDNLQVTVKNIHIRYEDQITKEFAFGVTLEKLELFTVNKEDEQKFVDRSLAQNKNQPLRKRLIVSNLGVYWNQKAGFFKKQEIGKRMISTIATAQNKGKTELNYILLMSTKAMLFQRDSGKQFTHPQIELKVQFNELKLEVMNVQLQQIVDLLERFLRYRNMLGVANRQKVSLDEALKNRDRMFQIFKKQYEGQALTADEQKEYDQILEKMDVSNFTQKINQYLLSKQKDRLIKEKKQKTRGWFSGPKDITLEQIKGIQKFLSDHFTQEEEEIKRPEDYFHIVLHVSIKKLQIGLSTNSSKSKSEDGNCLNEGIRTQFRQIDFNYSLREKGYKMNFTMDDFRINLFRQIKNKKNEVIDQQTTQFLMKYQGNPDKMKINPNANKYIDMTVQGHPLQKPGLDTDVRVVTQELLVIFDPKIVKLATDFANIQFSQETTEAALQVYGQVKEATTVAVKDTLRATKKNFIAVDVVINTVNVVLYADPAKPKGNCWHVALGVLQIHTDQETLKKKEFLPNEPMEKYIIDLKHLSLNYFDSMTSFIAHHNQEPLDQSKQQKMDQLMKEITLSLQIDVFHKPTKQVPKFRFSTKLHTLNFTLTKLQYQNLLKVPDCFNIPDQQVKTQAQKDQQKAQEKSKIMKNARKIGMIYVKEITGWNKYIAVYSGNYLYLYADKKKVQYSESVFTKIAAVKAQTAEEGEDKGKPYVLSLISKLTSMELGFDQKDVMEDWQKIIEQTNRVDSDLVPNVVDIAQAESKKRLDPIKKTVIETDPDKIMFEVNAQIEEIVMRASLGSGKHLDFSITKLEANVKLCEAKILIKASLQHIGIKDDIYHYKMKSLTNFLYSVENKQSNKLIDLEIAQLNRKHPQYKFIDNQINVNFGTLACNYKTQTVKALISFFIPTSMLQSPEALKANIELKSEEQLAQIQKGIKDIVNDQHKSNIDSAHQEEIKQLFSIKVSLSIQAITLDLVNQKTKTLVGGASILNFGLEFSKSNKRILLKGALGQIVYQDYSGYPYTIVSEQQNYDAETFQLIRMRRPKKTDEEEQEQIKQDQDKDKNDHSMIVFNVSLLEKPKPGNQKKIMVEATLQNLQIRFFKQPVLRIITYLQTQLIPSVALQAPKSSTTSTVKQGQRPTQPKQDSKETQTKQDSQSIYPKEDLKNIQAKKEVVEAKLSQSKQSLKQNNQKPQESPIDIKARLLNISVVLQPDVRKSEEKRQFMRLTIDQIDVGSQTFMRQYVNDWKEGEEKTMADNYNVQVKGLGIYAQYSKKGSKNDMWAITNQMDIKVSVDIAQNTIYYSRIYGQRYQPGIRIDCGTTPFIMRINHEDFTFIMKCVNWCLLFEDRADYYLYDIPQKDTSTSDKEQKEQKQDSQQPIYFKLILKELSLAVTDINDQPMSLLAISDLALNLHMDQNGMDMNLIIKRIAGTNLSSTLNDQQLKEAGDQNSEEVVVERGMFNAFGYHKIHRKSALDSLEGLQAMFSQNDSFHMKQTEKPTVQLVLSRDIKNTTIIDVTVNELKIEADLRHILVLSNLAIPQASAQPPQAKLQLHQIAKRRQEKIEAQSKNPDDKGGITQVVIKLGNFMASISDQKNLNFIVMEGYGIFKLKMAESRTEEQIMKMAPRTSQSFLENAYHLIELNDFSIYFCKISEHPKNKRQILRPIKASVLLNRYYSSNDGNIFLTNDIAGEITQLILEASIKDIIKINLIVQDNLQALAGKNKNADKDKEEALQNLMKEVPLEQTISEILPQRASINAGNQKYMDKVSKEMKKVIKDKTQMRMVLSPLQLTIVNDCDGNFMPVVKFIIEQSQPIYTGGAFKNQLAYNLTFHLNFFNPRSSNWEPIIEPYQMNLVYLTLTTEFGPKTHIIVEGSKLQEYNQLRLNVSTQFITELMQTLDMAKKQKITLQSKGDHQYIQVSPFIFENVTNQQIRIKRQLNDQLSQYILAPGFYGSIRLADDVEVLDFQIAQIFCQLSLQHYGLVKIPELEYFVQFKVDKLNRFIRFLAPQVLTNQTSQSLLCRRINFNNETLPDVQIKHGGQLALDNVQYFQVSINQQSYSQIVDVKHSDHRSLIRSENNKFILAMVNQTKHIKKSQFNNYRLSAVWKIFNCLPKDINVQFIIDNNMVSTKQIHRQQAHEVFANENINKMSMKLLVHGFYWSEELMFRQDLIGKESYLILRDPGDNQTTIKFKFQRMHHTHQIVLILFCKGFIVPEMKQHITVFGTLLRDKEQERYYPLGGQYEQTEQSHRVVIVGFENGDKVRICGRSGFSDFSKPISIGGLGFTLNRVTLDQEVNGQLMSLFSTVGVDISIKQMHKEVIQVVSRQIRIQNQSIVVNNSGRKLFFKEQGAAYFLFEIQPNQKKSFFFTMPQIHKENQFRRIICRGQETSESYPMHIDGLGRLYFRLRQPDNTFSPYKITITQVKNFIFYQIKSIKISELPYQIAIRSDELQVYIPRYNITIDSWSIFAYINESNSDQQFDIQIRHKKGSSPIPLMVKPDDLHFRQKVKINYVSEGLVETMSVKVSVLHKNDKKFLVISQSKKPDIQQIREFQMQAINLRLQKISISLIHNHQSIKKPFEAFLLYLHDLEYVCQKTNKVTRHQLKLQFLQLDQQQPQFLMNPVVITPYKYKQFMGTDKDPPTKSIFNCLVEIDNSFVNTVLINQVTVDFNNLVVKISQDFIKLILQMVQEIQTVLNIKEDDYIIAHNVNEWQKLEVPKESSKILIKCIKLGPFVVEVTAQLKLNKKQQSHKQVQFLKTILSAMGVVITNIDGAPISLDGLQITDYVDSIEGLKTKLIAHYKRVLIKQIYKIFGSLNIIGNPMSLFKNVSTGVKDFAEKPAQGLVRGPLEFGKGLAQGTSSLVAHSVGGALNSLQKLTGTISSGLAVLTFDNQFQERRQKAKMQKPKHVFEGVQKGGKAAYYGFKEGVKGVVKKPYESTKKGGVRGFFKGTAKGLTGLIVKPVIGIFDFASKTTQGLKNTAMYLQDKPNQIRIRNPRVFYTECYTLRDYDALESELNFVMQKKGYKEKNPDSYFIQSSMVNQQEGTFMVLTRKHILMINTNKEKIRYEIPINHIQLRQDARNGVAGIRISSKFANDIDQFFQIPDDHDRRNFVATVETLINQYN